SGLRAASGEGVQGFFDFLQTTRTPSIESKKRQDVAVDGLEGPIGINDLNTFILGSQFEIAVPDAVIEFQVLGLESTFVFSSRVIAGARPGESDLRLDIEEKRYIGPT